MPDNGMRRREKNVTGQGKPIAKKGSGLGTGPVGNKTGYSGRGESPKTGSSFGGGHTSSRPSSSSGSTPTRSSGKSSLLTIIIAAVVLLGGGGGLSSLLGGGDSGSSVSTSGTASTGSYVSSILEGIGSSGSLSSLGGSILSGSAVSSGWDRTSNNGKLDTTVASGARAKRTTIIGNKEDVVTIMVYMCGTDLESKNSMGTYDLNEMLKATIGDNVNLLVYTGGCKKWNNNVVNAGKNQIYKIENGNLVCLEDNMGTGAMTNPDTLSEFIKWCAKNYPANRNELIFWDHGGGSISGYGYDEKNSGSGSMTLSLIDKALKNGGITFDFIGFDACLMATAETALMLSDYADYLVASEETEPGVGWYYTDWLTKLSADTSMDTLLIGKNIADDFVSQCAKSCAGQKTTLSVIDLAELETTLPTALSEFASSTTEMISDNEYKTVSDARAETREFAQSSKIDQVDLIHLAYNMGTDESEKLADKLLSAVKYNRTSTNMTNAYGLSIYFPSKSSSYVDSAVATYDAIGLDDEYGDCIKAFASMTTGGQAISGGSSSALSSLSGSGLSSLLSSDTASSILSGLMSGSSLGNVSGLSSSNSDFLSALLGMDKASTYLLDNRFDASALVWQDGKISLPDDQWGLVQNVELNVFYDDGEGYIDLGLDNIYDVDEDGALLESYDGTWLAINEQPVPYYYESTVCEGDDYCITGRVPCRINGDYAELILVFDNDNPYGIVAGYRFTYRDGETETVAKGASELNDGDVIEFVCDYYSYDGEYLDSYLIGDEIKYDGEMTISNVYIDEENTSACYRFTDIYNQTYWTEVIG